jgi:hypothetical protein
MCHEFFHTEAMCKRCREAKVKAAVGKEREKWEEATRAAGIAQADSERRAIFEWLTEKYGWPTDRTEKMWQEHIRERGKE